MRILCFLLFFMCLSGGFAQTVRFEHIGISDKPMPTFYIQKGKTLTYELTSSHLSLITTDPKTFEALTSYVRTSQPLQYESGELLNKFGRYRITFTNDENYPLSYELNISEARVFFEKLLPLLKPHVDFYDDVEKLIKRLG